MLKYLLSLGLVLGVLFANAQDDTTMQQEKEQMNETSPQDQRYFDGTEARVNQEPSAKDDFNPRAGAEETQGEDLGIYEDQETPKEEPLPEYEGYYEQEEQKIKIDQRGEYEDLEEAESGKSDETVY